MDGLPTGQRTGRSGCAGERDFNARDRRSAPTGRYGARPLPRGTHLRIVPVNNVAGEVEFGDEVGDFLAELAEVDAAGVAFDAGAWRVGRGVVLPAHEDACARVGLLQLVHDAVFAGVQAGFDI